MDKHYNDYVQIGLNIMRYRKEAGYTQLQLAEMTGFTPHADSSPSFCLWRQHRTSRWPPAPQ